MRALSFEEYERLSEAGRLVPVFREIPGDLLTPVFAFLRTGAERDRSFLLESIVGGERVARYSFIGRDPVARVEVTNAGQTLVDGAPADASLLDALREHLRPTAVEVPGLPRFTGGVVGYLSWDAARLFERLPDRHPRSDWPLASFALYKSLVAFDHVTQRIVLMANVEAGSRRAFESAQDTLDALQSDLSAAGRETSARGPAAVATLRGEPPPAEFLEAVKRAQQHIAAGDIFQVVLSRRFVYESNVDPFAVYRALRTVNPSPYMYFLKEGEHAVAGASPEMLVRVEGDALETHPIAGTRPRAGEAGEDARREGSLLDDEKEIAEHVMLVDLARNDLGRVSRVGSVATPCLMDVEHYSHVMHMVSRVVGRLDEGRDPLDALVATFPAGTLSGAPKIRAMELIDALEPSRRGLYGGALGYIDLRGNLDFCIAIRTLLFEAGQAVVQAGSGIVADSIPERELQETEAKAAAMREALELATSY